MLNMSLKEFILPLINSLDRTNYLLKSHHRRTAVIAFEIGKAMKLNEKQMTDLVIAAALHDIGALNAHDRDSLMEEDVSDPKPHCVMGYEMLKTCEVFADISQIVLHHHLIYEDRYMYGDDVKIESHIIQLADRVEIYIDQDEFILNQKDEIRNLIMDKKRTILHPRVCEAFETVSRDSQFWLNINGISLEKLFNEIDYGLQIPITYDVLTQLSTVLARVVDYRSHYTAAHSLTVGNLAQYLGEFFGKSEDFNIKLLVAGLLHDIGKFGISPHIIGKEDVLNDDEVNQLRSIPTYSKDILTDLQVSPWFEDVVDWITSTDQQSNDIGKSIIILSEIITALLEDRPYRPAKEIDEAINIIKSDTLHSLDKKLIHFIEEHKDDVVKLIHLYQKQGMDYYNEIEREFDYY